jgi:predicted nucleic acid-binding protein
VSIDDRDDDDVAYICIQQEATLITRNIKDFESLDLHTINPFLTP